MPVLALDTSAAVSVALIDAEGRTLATRVVHEERRHAEQLAPMIADVLAATGTDRTALTGIVVGTGPAPFTGLRVGLVSARALGLALDIPVHGVCGLDAIAAQAAIDLSLAAGTEVLVVTDARRREVYWARYRVAGAAPQSLRVELVAGPGVASAAQVAADGHADGAIVVGPGASLYPEQLPPVDGAPTDPDPVVLARLALARVALGEDLPTEPLYLRRPDVVAPAPRKHVVTPAARKRALA
ncbi:tRNA (adenosine(37)-N6)-threonylcarbamoyltransferase complex dimerization subunit type 1 TsaB [Pengzhenrongella frigida]|uniref:tRNA (Adenosine(37)-N6)-threonylcarbamoyltransferase complex dimerization subunit type 1 TsaB n=1 Tax=Pengzhenrongella frigida TaxID=1259133 RepID=A0A4Q5N706_9MICO|nr:tRNA (adenosine(37)-N6)-threonylcarbamoyltransferase complex dimerization subunit type 1 TsaB [Cellulomonas sp. HLT2-17]RYV52171.1 tRNA (adenosine(37)-N6)-threonylcarbamoyltransferase complex dimerization subunit type 1 TsaB [Cellulomonas sp. HLT2-17]